MKRMHARAKGRGARILKRTSHITVVVRLPASKARRSTMGHKVHPTGIRLGIAKDWNSEVVRQQARLRRVPRPPTCRCASCCKKKLAQAGVSQHPDRASGARPRASPSTRPVRAS